MLSLNLSVGLLYNWYMSASMGVIGMSAKPYENKKINGDIHRQLVPVQNREQSVLKDEIIVLGSPDSSVSNRETRLYVISS